MSDVTAPLQRTNPAKVNPLQMRSWLFPHPLAWAACWLTICIEFVWIASTDMSFRFGAAWGLAVTASVMLAIGVAKPKDREHLSMILYALAFFIIFGTQARVFN